MITVQFKDLSEMQEFAKEILNITSKPASKKVAAETKEVTTETGGSEVREEITVTLEEVRAKLATLTRSGKQKEVKELLTSFGAKNLSSVDPKDYAALMEKAGAL